MNDHQFEELLRQLSRMNRNLVGIGLVLFLLVVAIVAMFFTPILIRTRP
jgi:hypothetical protein